MDILLGEVVFMRRKANCAKCGNLKRGCRQRVELMRIAEIVDKSFEELVAKYCRRSFRYVPSNA